MDATLNVLNDISLLYQNINNMPVYWNNLSGHCHQ